MPKKILKYIMISTLIISLNALAGGPGKYTEPPAKSPLDGLYAAFVFGLVSGDSRNFTTSDVDLVNGGAGNPNSIELFNNNLNEKLQPQFGMNIGYGIAFSARVYTGAEFFVDTRRQNAEGSIAFNRSNNGGLVFSVKNDVTVKDTGAEYGVRLRPGYLFTPRFLLYAVIGYIRTKFNVISETDYNRPAGNDRGTSTLDITKSDSGIEAGLGVEYSLGPRFSIRGEYVFTGYEPIDLNGTAPITGAQAGDNIVNRTSVTPKNQKFLISFQYFFT